MALESAGLQINRSLLMLNISGFIDNNIINSINYILNNYTGIQT